MKISLIEPKSADYHVYSALAIPRLGLPQLGSVLQQQGHQVKIYCEDLEGFTPAKAREVLSSDLVGISLTSSTAPRGYTMARLLRVKGVPVVFGGVHVTFMPEEALRYGDYVIVGEGEEALPELVKTLERGGSLSEVPNLVYNDSGRIVYNEKRPLRCGLDELPIPDLGLVEGSEKLRILPVMTTRGCPHGCTFCCVTPMFGRKYRMASVDGVLEQLRRLGRSNVFFCDDNFTAVPHRTKELLSKMLSRRIVPRRWSAQVRAEVYRDQEMLDLMRRTNCSRVYVGFESINQSTLDELNKHQSVEDIRRCISQFHRHNIAVHGMFMFGADSDTLETFAMTRGFALDNHIDTVQFLILTPPPGSQLFKQLDEQGRIFTYDWTLYDGHHVVFEPANMSPLELQLESLRAHRQFYSMRSAFRSLSCLRLSTAMLRYLGRGLVKRWYGKNADFLKRLWKLKSGYRTIPRRFSLLPQETAFRGPH